jgi:ABC-type lipoprotein export system ATPase subunit
MNDPEPDASAPAPETAILRAEGLVKHYSDGNVQALRGVSLKIAQGDFVAITGPSGCGKSTLLHLLGGLDRPTQGEVYYREQSLSRLDLDAFHAHEIGFVFQSFHLMATLTAIENVQIPMFESNRPRRARAERAGELLGEVGLSHRRDHRPSQLSPTILPCSWPMSRPATSTARARRRSSICSINSGPDAASPW